MRTPEVLCEQKHLRPGDILLSLEKQICIDFVALEGILDSKVGSEVEMLVCRGGQELTLIVAVVDLHSLIPRSAVRDSRHRILDAKGRCFMIFQWIFKDFQGFSIIFRVRRCRSYVELGLDAVHGLGYHAARKTHLPWPGLVGSQLPRRVIFEFFRRF